MVLNSFISKVGRFYEARAAKFVFRRPIHVGPSQPLISFTFDDFPKSAIENGGAILQSIGANGTYYASLGLMGRDAPAGRLFVAEDLKSVIDQGHELGCHTFSHSHSWETKPAEYEQSIVANRSALRALLPDAEFRSFSYPISSPRPLTKAKVGKYFSCSRGGGQTFNTGVADLNQLSAFFLEKSRDRMQDVQRIIDQNRDARGWLIFATHDVCNNPSPFGCTQEFFEEVVRYSVRSGAKILPVIRALGVLQS